MRARLDPVEALVTLPRLADPAERRSAWRQALTALGQHVRVTGPPPLDGTDPADLSRAAQLALEAGLVDEVDFIGPDAAAVALYELSAALPAGRERREIGRRVFARLYQGTAATFAAVAARMALGAGRPLEAPTLKARVSLVFDLPLGSTVNADPLAFALVSRRELFERWIERPSLGPLPARRLAAKLFEHAAREAVVRAQQGDHHARDVLADESVRPVFDRLLADREPLVWRHVAVARGLLSSIDRVLEEQIEIALDPALTPTEWRRAAASLAASLAVNPEHGKKSCRALLESDVARNDPGIAATMVWGLAPVVEAEPDVGEELLDRLAATRRPDVTEAVAGLLSDLARSTFGLRAASTLRAVMSGREDSGLALGFAMELLDREDAKRPSIHMALRSALMAYETAGAQEAHELAIEAAAAAGRATQRLLARDTAVEARFVELGDLDTSVLERSRLRDLLLLARRPGESGANVPELDSIHERLGEWLLDETAAVPEQDWARALSQFDQRRLRALLHLVDLETAQAETDESRIRARVRRTIHVLLQRLTSGPDGAVHRLLAATLARSFDAAVREGVAEPSDLLLVAAQHLTDRGSVAAIHEASTNPDVAQAFSSWSRFMDRFRRDGMESIADTEEPLSTAATEDDTVLARRIVRLSRGFGAGGSYRGEALRQVVLRMGRALEVVAAARGLTELVDSAGSGSDPLGDLEESADAFRKLAAGARRRVLDEPAGFSVVADVAPLSALVARTVGSGVPANAHQIAMAAGELVADLPVALGNAVSQVVSRIDTLPIAAASDVFAIPLEKRRAALPDWLLPRRTIGAFYVVRALGSGGASSVFIARRVEERHDKRAEAFALKVPQYDPTTARSLSEQEFLQMFRDEASALLALPQYPNLARFVTFDMAARPKPILVMELISGTSLDRLIRSRALDAQRAFQYLDGILAGLAAMHGAGVGHLDVKPSNVILRDGETPVLVDFGLSGRQLRPGCGTLEYCAPEVLGVVPEHHVPSPLATDIYAFACLAFEVLTSEPLFDADDETAIMSLQVSHDGWPHKLIELGGFSTYRELAVVLAACLRRDPRARPDVAAVRAALAPVGRVLSTARWPFAVAQDIPVTA